MTDPKRPEDLPRLTDEERAELDSGYVAMAGVPEGEPAVPTPDEWWIENDERGEGGGISVRAIDPADAQMFEVCEVWGIDRQDEHDERSCANAHLIAAAQKMLATLKHIERACEPGTDQSDDEIKQFIANVRMLARAAINAAEDRQS